MDPVTFLTIAQAATASLKHIKETFFDTRKAEDLKRKTFEHVDTLACQVALNKAIVDELVTQFEAARQAIAQHNEILLGLNEAAQAAAREIRRLRAIAYAALGVSVVAIAVMAAIAVRLSA